MQCFGLPKTIPNVKFTGKVLAPIGMPVYVEAHAGYVKLEVKCESAMMTLKVKSFFRCRTSYEILLIFNS